MTRTLFGVALCLAAPLLADDADPEPGMKGAAKSGDLVAKADNGGTVTVTKGGKAIWATTLADGFGCPSQVVFPGGRVVVARDCIQTGLDVGSGKILWVRKGDLAKGKLTAKGDRVTLTEGKKREVIDAATGKLIESER